jgi:hypothetical protein
LDPRRSIRQPHISTSENALPHEVAPGECATGAGFQVALEPQRAVLTCEFYAGYKSPRSDARTVGGAAGIVHFDSPSYVGRHACVVAGWVFAAAKDVHETCLAEHLGLRVQFVNRCDVMQIPSVFIDGVEKRLQVGRCPVAAIFADSLNTR